MPGGNGNPIVKGAIVDPLKNRNIGRRTGVDVKAGKNIRKNEEGFELFDDYWTESDDESLYFNESRRGRGATNLSLRTLSNNKANEHPPLRSMSPFAPSSVENSAPCIDGTKQGGPNGAPLNYEGEVLGTITRLDNDKKSQATNEVEQPCSALANFRMKKRLRYSEAPHKSSETEGSDQVFAVPRLSGKGRHSTPSQVTSKNAEGLPIIQGSSDVGNSTTDVNSEADSDLSEAPAVNNTLRRSSRRSTSVYRHESQVAQEDAASSADSEVMPTKTESVPNDSPRKQRSARKSRSKQRESDTQSNVTIDGGAMPTDASNKTVSATRQSRRNTRKSISCSQETSSQETLGSQVSMNNSNTIDTGADDAESLASELSQTVNSHRKRLVTSRSSRKSKGGCPETSNQESFGSQASMNNSNTIDTGATDAESLASEVSQTVNSQRKRSVTSRSSRKSKGGCPEISSQETLGSQASMNNSNAVDTGADDAESLAGEVSQTVNSQRKRSVAPRSSRKSKGGCPETSSQETLGSQTSMNNSNAVDTGADDAESLASEVSQTVNSQRKRSVALRSSRKSKGGFPEMSSQETLGSQTSMNNSNTIDTGATDAESLASEVSQTVNSQRKRSLTPRSSRKSKRSCSETSSQETLGLLRSSRKSKGGCPETSSQESQQSSGMNIDASDGTETEPTEAESQVSNASQSVDSPRKRPVMSTSTPSKLNTSTHNKSNTSTPSKSNTSTPSKLNTSTPSKLNTSIPSKLNTSTPSKLNTSTHNKSNTSTPSKSNTSTPSKLNTSIPSKLNTSIPSKLNTSIPSKLNTSIPSKSNTSTPSKLNTSTHNKSNTTTPSKSNTSTSKSRSPQHPSEDMQVSEQSTNVLSVTNVFSESEPIVVKQEPSEESPNVDSPRKQTVAARISATPKSSCEPVNSNEETHSDEDKRVRVTENHLTTVNINTEHVSEASSGEKPVVDSPVAPSQQQRSPSASPRKQTSCPVHKTQSESDESVASDDDEHSVSNKVGCSEVAMDTDDFLSDSTSETEEQWSVPPASHLIGAGDGQSRVTDHDVDGTSPSDVGHIVSADTRTECRADADDDDRLRVIDGGKTSADADGYSDTTDDPDQHSLYKTSSPLIIEKHSPLPDEDVSSPTKGGATGQGSSSDDVSRQLKSPAKTQQQAVNATSSDDKQFTDGLTSEEDFEIDEPCFRVFGNLKQSAADKSQGVGVGKHSQVKPRKVAAKSQKSRGRPVGGKKAGTTKVSAIPSPDTSDGEEGACPRLQNGEGRQSKSVVSAKTCESPTETPSVPPVPKKIQSIRRKINLSASVTSRPGGSTSNCSDALVDATGKSPKKRISLGKPKEIPRDEVVEPEDVGLSESEYSLPHRRRKLTKKGKRSPAQRKNTDEDSEGETRGKGKTAKPRGKKRKNSQQEKGKKQRGGSPKRGRIVSPKPLSDDEFEEPLDVSLGSPRHVLSFDNSNQDISLQEISLSPIKGKRPSMLPGRSPSPPSAIVPSKTKRKLGMGSQRRKSSNPQKMSPAAQKKLLALEKNMLKPRQLSRLKGAKQRRSVYALTPVVKTSSPKSAVMPGTVPKSILKKSSRYSSGTPVHYCDTTETAATPYTVPSQASKNVKIMVPSPSDDEAGVRRSHRTRVQPLDWFRNERILYKPRKSGGFVVAGIVSPEVLQVKREMKKKQRKLSPKTARSRQPAPATPRNLSVHQPLPEDCSVVTSTHIDVINPTTEEEVSVECIKPCDAFNFCGPKGKASTATDPLILCKALNQKAFSVGHLILRPLQEKGTHYVRHDTMVFIIKKGKLAVTIHKTTSVLETDDVFFIPQGNTYNLTNLRNDEAKLWFFQLKQ